MIERIREALAGRKWAVAGFVAMVVLAAAVILGVSMFTQPDSDSARAPSDLERSTSLDLLEAAGQAEAEGDLSAAEQLLKQALVLDPTNESARTALTRVTEEARNSASPTGQPGEETPDDPVAPVDDPDAGFLAPVDDVRVLMPTQIPGWRMDPVFGTPSVVNATAEPTPEIREIAARLLVFVHDRGTAASADEFIEKTSRTAYGVAGEDVVIDGVPAYFGTDGVGLATCSYARGRYVFEILITSANGAPIMLRDLAMAAAESFPDELP